MAEQLTREERFKRLGIMLETAFDGQQLQNPVVGQFEILRNYSLCMNSVLSENASSRSLAGININ
jgi:hypothetical protein